MVLKTLRECDECHRLAEDCLQVRLERKGYLMAIGSSDRQQVASTDLCMACFNKLPELVVFERSKN
jgi:hypothetical protein